MAISTVDHYELIQQLTTSIPGAPLDNRRRLNDFAFELGWRPSDQLSLPGTEEFASGHLVVEHGLQNSAVISFLRKPARYPSLDIFQQKTLLNASYNNLIDWHIAVDYEGASFVYNRAAPPRFFSYRKELGRDRTSELSSYAFDTLSTDHPSPSVLALDTALIRTISLWKRQLSAELGFTTNEEISALFNSVILIRALEDYHGRDATRPFVSLRQRLQESELRVSQLLTESVETLAGASLPNELFDVSKLREFDRLDSATTREFIGDFYRNRFEPYFDYDFAMMSKHALSRIYEHYVSLLRFDDNNGQQSFFPRLPNEKVDRSFGNVYTPEFIARFFAKYLRKELPLSRFQRLKIGDPACGSGIFLRAMLETKFDALLDSFTTQSIAEGFDLISGIDIDPNACAAARLSLSLLSLVLIGKVPDKLDIRQADTLAAIQTVGNLPNSLDVLVTNPPFVSIDDLPPERKGTLLEVLGDSARGKTDLYLGLLKAGIAMLKGDGFGMVVLPKNFLISDNAAPLRDELSRSATLHCVVDLSAVRVFEDVGAYVVLIVFQKQSPDARRPVMVVRCDDLVGPALENALQGTESRTSSYEVFWGTQPLPGEEKWEFTSPERLALQTKLSRVSTLGEIAEIRQGLITGADDVFLVPPSSIPKREKEIYAPLLSDREIEPYKVPAQTKRFVIYPFRDGKALNEEELKKNYPATWAYLLSHKEKLTSRRSVRDSRNPWWRPIRPRQPEKLICPKIVTPHIVISPRFALDPTGRYAVSHGPYILPRASGGLDELMCMLGLLNSSPCFWLITQSAHGYSRGYSRLEVTTLSRTPIPDPVGMDRGLVRKIIQLVQARMDSTRETALDIERELDELAAAAYGLSESDKRLVGIGKFE